MSDDNIVHFNPWRDFNDAPILDDPSAVDVDPAGIRTFLDVVFSWCEGFIPVRGFVDKGQGAEGRPHNIWVEADAAAAGKLATFAAWAAREGAAVYVVPGTVAEHGQARAAEVTHMQTVLVDLDAGDVSAKLAHLSRYLGEPTLVVESGGRTPEGLDKLHAWWKLSEAAEGEDIALVTGLRGDIAIKVGGDTHFRSAHQPIRVPGTVYHKGGHKRLVRIAEHRPGAEVHLTEFAEAIAAMPPLAGVGTEHSVHVDRPTIDTVLTTPVHEGGADAWTRFAGASAAIGHFVRQVHDGRMSPDDAWEAICQYNAAMLRPAWPLERLKAESDRLWSIHVERNGPALLRASTAPFEPPPPLPVFSLGALLDDGTPMPPDIIAPRLLTIAGLLVLAGAPKVGKSDLLIHLLVHMAAGRAFLGFTPSRPLRIFYLQAEIQYHYLRERLQSAGIDPAVLQAARDNLAVTPKLKLLLDEQGLKLVIAAIRQQFPDSPPDIICIDPIRNLFDGGPDGGSENDNAAMMHFLVKRVEALREAVNPDAGIILCHHTRKATKREVAEDPFLALSGASALRSFYTSGIIMHRPDEEHTERKLEIELRNGPAIGPMLVDKVGGRWAEVKRDSERLVRKDLGERLDAERLRKQDVIIGILLDEALKGDLYTVNQFVERFENQAGLGGAKTIRERISVLLTKGYLKFVKQDDLPSTKSRHGYLCAEGLELGPACEHIDPATGEVTERLRALLPTHYKCPNSGAVLPVEDPSVWIYHAEEVAR